MRKNDLFRSLIEPLEFRRLLSLTIHTSFDASVTSLPLASQVESAFNYAAAQYQGLFSNPITLNIELAARAGTGIFGQSSFTTLLPYTYSTVVTALAANATTPAIKSAIAGLGATDPTHGGKFEVCFAECKALGFRPANAPAIDGIVTFGTGSNFTFDPENRSVAGKFDFIGLAEHEISEIMGRNFGLGTPYYAPFDLFRYSAPGVHSFSRGAGQYFSIDNGATVGAVFNSVPNQDPQDWGATPVYRSDAFNSAAMAGYLNGITPVDIEAMQVLGYTPATTTSVATQLAIRAQPSTVVAGVSLSPISVQVDDGSGAALSTDTSTVTLSIASGPAGGTLIGTSRITAVGGVAEFSGLSFTKAGSYVLTASDGSLTGAKSAVITVTPAAAAKFQIVTQPTTGIAGAPLGAITVEVVDAFGNVVTSAEPLIAPATFPSGAALVGTASETITGGIATFTGLRLSKSGNYTFKFSFGSLSPVLSGVVTLAPAAASRLVFAQQPTAGTHGTALSPGVIVDVEDAYGNIVTSDNSTVTLGVYSGPSGATIGGTLVIHVVKGVATFGKLTVSKTGTYTFDAIDGKLASAVSRGIAVK
jgi:hypothetical protein